VNKRSSFWDYPFSLLHFTISRYPLCTATKPQLSLSQGQPFSLAHFSNSRCPFFAAMLEILFLFQKNLLSLAHSTNFKLPILKILHCDETSLPINSICGKQIVTLSSLGNHTQRRFSSVQKNPIDSSFVWESFGDVLTLRAPMSPWIISQKLNASWVILLRENTYPEGRQVPLQLQNIFFWSVTSG